MIQIYPSNALEALEYNKIIQLLLNKCRTDAARARVAQMRIHSKTDIIERELLQTHEFKNTLSGGDYFPNDFTDNLDKALRLLSVSGATLSAEELLKMVRLSVNTRDILNWFKRHRGIFPALENVTEKALFKVPDDVEVAGNEDLEVVKSIRAVIDEVGQVRDNASQELMSIRNELDKLRIQLRKVFEGILRKLNKQGYLADIAESFLNGRRTVAIFAEHKRIVKGILHGESDSQRTVFIEPEETIDLNNEIFSLEQAEAREIKRILKQATADIAQYYPHLRTYYALAGILDFIRAKALLAKDLQAEMPVLSKHPSLKLVKARHPLLYLHNIQAGKEVVPLNLELDKENRILMISGPNAGGKTVSMKTAGLLQVMLQSGLLVPAAENSEMGIYKQIMIHIGDTQSIENELSTYSAHLRDMKYFLEFANGKTLFFIDELGSGSDPNLGGAFAEAIVEEIARKKAQGIITTHYLNLKVMAGKVNGIFNGAMAFDEERLEPLYQLVIGKPGSSYTFAIAKRSRLPQAIIDRARQLTERNHFKLDKILHQTEQQSVRLGDKEKYLDKLIDEHEKARRKYEELTDKERLKQHYATLKLQNEIKKEELEYLRDTERKFKQIIHDWKKTENKQEVIETAETILFKKKQIQANVNVARKTDKLYDTIGGKPQLGDFVRNKVNHQVGTIADIKDKKAIVKIGRLPFTVNLDDWIVVRKKETPLKGKK